MSSDPFLDRPNLSRVIFEVEGRFRVGGCSMQGWRRNMEDSFCALIDPLGDGSVSFFCVCDGHGGPECATEVTRQMPNLIASCPMINNPDLKLRTYAEGLAWIVGKAEEHLQQMHMAGTLPSCGTTFVGILVTATQIFCANVGDSRAVMARGAKAVDLSRDHKPTSQSEVARVHAVGGTIRNGRLGGLLAMTRALGDFELKNPKKPAQKQALLAIPEVSSCSRVLASAKDKNGGMSQEATFIVLACDGIWDCLTSQEVVNFFLEEHVCDEDVDVAFLCESLTRMIVAPRLQPIGSDNMTSMVIVLKPSSSSSTTDLMTGDDAAGSASASAAVGVPPPSSAAAAGSPTASKAKQ